MTNVKKWIGIIGIFIGIIVSLMETEIKELLGVEKNFRIFIAFLMFLSLVFVILASRPQSEQTQNLDPKLIKKILIGVFVIVLLIIFFGFIYILVVNDQAILAGGLIFAAVVVFLMYFILRD